MAFQAWHSVLNAQPAHPPNDRHGTWILVDKQQGTGEFCVQHGRARPALETVTLAKECLCSPSEAGCREQELTLRPPVSG